MLRAIIVNVGTVAGVSAALLYQPQADVLEFAGGVLSGGSDTSLEQTREPDQPNIPQPEETNNRKKKKNNDGKASPSTSSNSPSPSSSSSSPEPTKSASPTPTPSKSATPTPTPTPTSNVKDGTYNGDRVEVFYVDGGTKRKSGNLKVHVIIKNGKVSDIVWTEYPTGDHQKYTNRAYTASAKPLVGLTVAELKSAKVATKTGATGTSTAFVTSLESVLHQL